MSYSLLNSVLGPVMRGPSSSHTAGPFFIADTIRQLALGDGEAIVSANVYFDPYGSYARVYKNQGSDQGMAAGLLGRAMTDVNYAEAIDDIKEDNVFDLSFNIGALKETTHPNDSDINLEIKQVDGSFRTEIWRSVSLGGGMFKVTALNDIPLCINGAYFVTLIETESNSRAEVLKNELNNYDLNIQSCNASKNYIELQTLTLPERNIVKAISETAGVVRIKQCNPAQYVIQNPEPLLDSCESILLSAKRLSLHELAESYEANQLGIEPQEVRQRFSERLDIMLRSVEESLHHKGSQMKFLEPTAASVMSSPKAKDVVGSLFSTAIAASLAVLESGTNRGIVVAAPTAGSAGIIPGILYSLIQHGFDKDDCVRMLEVAALVGAIVAQKATFAAEVAGCNAETGVSAAMAAAGLAHIYGATPQQAMDAASVCMMNTMGLVCDPVNGEVEIPCHARNVGGISHVIGSVTAVLGGFKAVLPMDELIDAMMEVAGKTHVNMLCTAKGGCAITPTAISLSQKVSACNRCLNV